MNNYEKIKNMTFDKMAEFLKEKYNKVLVFRVLCLILIPLNLFIAFHARFNTLNFISALYLLICWGYVEWRITNE